jgi:hypothetical protein
VSAAALLAWSGEALAKAPPPKAKESSSISQYRESIPGASGPTLPGNTSTRTPLPPAVEQRVVTQGGTDTHDLRKISEESNFGAPPRHALPIVPRQQVVDDERKGLPSAVFKSAGNLVGGEDGHITGLVVVMGLIAVGAAGLAVRRRAT